MEAHSALVASAVGATQTSPDTAGIPAAEASGDILGVVAQQSDAPKRGPMEPDSRVAAGRSGRTKSAAPEADKRRRKAAADSLVENASVENIGTFAGAKSQSARCRRGGSASDAMEEGQVQPLFEGHCHLAVDDGEPRKQSRGGQKRKTTALVPADAPPAGERQVDVGGKAAAEKRPALRRSRTAQEGYAEPGGMAAEAGCRKAEVPAETAPKANRCKADSAGAGETAPKAGRRKAHAADAAAVGEMVPTSSRRKGRAVESAAAALSTLHCELAEVGRETEAADAGDTVGGTQSKTGRRRKAVMGVEDASALQPAVNRRRKAAPEGEARGKVVRRRKSGANAAEVLLGEDASHDQAGVPLLASGSCPMAESVLAAETSLTRAVAAA